MRRILGPLLRADIGVRQQVEPFRVRLHQRVRRALDSPFDTEGLQQVAHERGLAGTERTMQLDEGIGERRVRGHRSSAQGAGGFVRPRHEPRF